MKKLEDNIERISMKNDLIEYDIRTSRTGMSVHSIFRFRKPVESTIGGVSREKLARLTNNGSPFSSCLVSPPTLVSIFLITASLPAAGRENPIAPSGCTT
ncbi:MAG TPA: hypothetical protein PK764_06640 [Deltaproteobacteria bacterium]|nr:hypothetical protein [Deltaproteobacteria bacterium]